MPDDELRNIRLHIRLTPLEREQLKAIADKNHQTMSEFLRLLLAREIKKNSF